MIVGKGTGFVNHNAPGWTVFTAYGYLYFQLNTAGVFGVSELQAQDVNGYNRVCDGSWHHVVITYSGSMYASGVAFYVDGNPQTLGNDINDLNAGDITNDADPTIGATPTPDGFYHGALAELDVFNQTLTTADDQTLYANGAGDYGAVGVQGLVAGYHLDSSSGPVTDYSAYGNNGTLEGTFNTSSLVTGKVQRSVASITVSDLALGSHSITAQYGGDSSYAASASDPLDQTVQMPTLYWYPQGNSVSGSDWVWSTTAANWNTLPNGNGSPSVWINGYRAVIGGDPGVITIEGGPIQASWIDFQSDGFTLAGDTLAIASTGMTIQVDSGTATVTTLLADAGSTGGLTTTGAGTVELDATNNDIPGGTVVAAGTLDVEGGITGPVSTTGGQLVGSNAPLIPSVSVDSQSVSGLVDQAVTNTGEWSPPGTDTGNLSATDGAVTDNNDGTWNWNWTPPAGTSPGIQTVTITATDTTSTSAQRWFGGFANLRSRFAGDHGHDPQHRIASRGGHRLPVDDLCNRRRGRSASATPTGKMDFFDGAKYLGIVSLYQSDQGQTSFTLSSGLSAGPHSITLVYTSNNGLDCSVATRQITASTAPTVQTSASVVSLTPTTVTLSVAGADVGESNLTYSWAATPETAALPTRRSASTIAARPTKPRPPSVRPARTPSQRRSQTPKGSSPRAQ